MGVGHLPHIGDILDLLEGLLQDAFQLIALCQMVGHHFQFIFQPINLFPHPADLIVEFLPANEVIGVHIHVFLPGLLQLGKLGGQLLFIVQVFILCPVYPLKLIDNVVNDILLGLQQPGEILLQNLDEFIFIHCHGVGAVVGSLSIVAGADPADIGILIGADRAPEGPAALFTPDQGGEQVFIALPHHLHLELPPPLLHQPLGLFKLFGFDDAQFRPLYHHPIPRVLFHPAPSEEVGHLLFAVDDLPGVELVGQDTAYTGLAPPAVPLGTQASFIEQDGDFCRPIAVFEVPLVDLAHNRRFFFVDGEVEIVPYRFIVTIDNIGHTALLRIHFLAELDPFGGVGALLLGQRPEDRQDEFAVAHACHVGGQELRFNAQGLEFPYILQKIHRVPGKPGNVFYHHHLKEAMFRVRHHP